MNWELAIEKNHGALKRILAMLVALVGMGDPRKSAGTGAVEHSPPSTLPRHLHRFVLRLLRPAEAATRRLIIVAARGLAVTLPKFYERKPSPKKPPLNRKNGYGTGIVIRPGPLPEWARELMPKRSLSMSLSLLDPMKRFGVRRRYAKRSAMPQIRVLGGDPVVPLFRRPEPLPPPQPTPDDPLDVGNIHRRLDALASALEDLPGQAMRMARWRARRDARWEREVCEPEQPQVQTTPSPSRASPSPPLPHFVRERIGASSPALAPILSPTQWGRGGEGEARDGEGGVKRRDGEGVDWDELGVTPEALALCRRRDVQQAQSNIATQTQKPRRHLRISPMRPGRPPGWRRKPNHDVYEVLNELHGLAVWARERRDSS